MVSLERFNAKEIRTLKEINSELIGKLDQKEFELIPTLYIGLGGTGKDILLRMRENLFVKHEEKFKDEKSFPIKFLYYDLDQSSSQYDDRGIYSDDYFKKIAFTDEERLLIKPDITKTLELIKRKEPTVSNISKWIGSGLQSIDTSFGAGQQRQISRLSFFVCFNEIEKAIKSKLQELGEIKKNTKHETNQTFRIVLVFSAAGGTGCGSFIDMAFLCKRLLKEVSTTANAKHEIISHVILPGAFKNISVDRDRINANGYAALKEIEYYMVPGNNFNVEWELGEPKTISGPILDRCYVISGDRYQNSPSFSSIQEVFNTVADYLSCEIDSSIKFVPVRDSAVSNCSDFLNCYIVSNISDKDQDVFYTDMNFYSCKYSSYGLSRIGTAKERIQKACSAQLGFDIIKCLKENPVKKYMPTIDTINKFERQINEINKLLEQKYRFYSDYKIPSYVKIIKDGREITDKDFKGIIRDYYQEVNDDFTGLVQTQLCDTDKNKFIEYLERWGHLYYEKKGIEKKDIENFFQDIINMSGQHDFNILFDAINELADRITDEKLKTKNKFSVFPQNTVNDNLIIKNHQKMMKLSSFCFKQASDVLDSGSNKICREDINFFRWVFSNKVIKEKKDYEIIYNDIANKIVYKNEEDSIDYFSEIHGFPLYFGNIEDLKNSYNKLKKDFTRPLHIEKNNDKFHDLIPFDYATIKDYKNKLKIGLMAMLFNVLKYEPEYDSFTFNYQRQPGDADEKKELKLGQMALEEMDENIVHLRKTVSVKECLENQYLSNAGFKYDGKILSEKGKLKLYFALMYINCVIEKNNKNIKEKMEVQNNKNNNGNNSLRMISSRVDSLIRIIIIDESIALNCNHESKLYKEFEQKYPLKSNTQEEWAQTTALYKKEIFDWIYEDKPAAAIKFRAEDVDFKE